MYSRVSAIYVSLLAGVATAQVGVTNPLAENCGPSTKDIVSKKQNAEYQASYHFVRNVSTIDEATTFGETIAGNGTQMHPIKSADFLVFDKERGREILGSKPSYEFMFQVPAVVHEAPVYVPSQNKLYFSQLEPGFLSQLSVNLSESRPKLSKYASNPPVYAPNGGTFHHGKILWGASGGNRSIGGGEQRPSLRTVDLKTNKATTLLNNYFGFYFNTIDDLIAHPKTGDIWFTDPQYSWFQSLSDTAPQLPCASYRYNATSGAVFLVDDTLKQPNGIAFSPDGSTLYISDSQASRGTVDPKLPPSGNHFNETEHRTVYAFDVSSDGTRITNKRAVYLAAGFLPDGLKVAANGYIVTANGKGVDVLDPLGQLLVTVQTNYTVNNFAFTGPELKTLWLTGSGGISKVDWNLAGQKLK